MNIKEIYLFFKKEISSKDLDKKVVIGLWVFVVIFIFSFNTSNHRVTTRDRCLSVSPSVVSWIEKGLRIDGGGSLRNVAAVKSDDFENIYFVSGDLQGAGLEGDHDIATFAINSLSYSDPAEGKLVLSVDAAAKEFSDWFYGPNTKFNTVMSNDGALESRNCINK